jgi:hypothetical protein
MARLIRIRELAWCANSRRAEPGSAWTGEAPAPTHSLYKQSGYLQVAFLGCDHGRGLARVVGYFGIGVVLKQ